MNGQNHFVGITGGASWTNVKTRNFIKNTNDRTGFTVGLSYNYIFKENFMIGMDVLHDQRGFSSEIIYTDDWGNPTGSKATMMTNYDYLTIPLKMGFHYGQHFLVSPLSV